MRLLDRLSDPKLRTWYARKTIENGWSRNVLELQIKSKLHERQGAAPLGEWPDVSEYPQFGKKASEALDVVSHRIEVFTAEARSDLGTEKLSEQLCKVLLERVMGIRSF